MEIAFGDSLGDSLLEKVLQNIPSKPSLKKVHFYNSMCVSLKLKKSYNQRGYLIPHRVETGTLELPRFQLLKTEISTPSCYGYLTVIKSPYYAV